VEEFEYVLALYELAQLIYPEWAEAGRATAIISANALTIAAVLFLIIFLSFTSPSL
jgi:hypothetical protein